MRAAAPKKHAMPAMIIKSGLSWVTESVAGTGRSCSPDVSCFEVNEFPVTVVTRDGALMLFMQEQA
jgi:hypothetical protein